jgi:thioredoxin 1
MDLNSRLWFEVRYGTVPRLAEELRTLDVSDQIIHTSDAAFERDVLSADQPVLLDFWAEWCGPCKMIAPILDAIADEYKDRIRVVKLNIDENPQTPPKYNVRGIPTLLLFRGGSVAAQQVGAVSKAQLQTFIDSHLPTSIDKHIGN